MRDSQWHHHKWDYHITRSKISYSLIEPQPLPSTLAYAMNSMHLHSTHTPLAAPLVGSAFKIQIKVCGGVFLQKQSMCLSCWLFRHGSSVVDVWQLCLRRFPPLELHKGILNSSCLLILLIHTKHKYNQM